MAAYEFALRTVDGLGLTPVEMDLMVAQIGAYATAQRGPRRRPSKVRAATGLTRQSVVAHDRALSRDAWTSFPYPVAAADRADRG